MGGRVPLGYDARDRTLVINAAEAETVRVLFDLYLELGCVRRLKDEADRRGLITKQHRYANGAASGGVAFSRGRLYHLLSNPVYAGEIRHRDQSYAGQHQAIIDRDTYEAVQQKLASNRRGSTNRALRASASPLAGKLVDETGDPLTPTHAVRHGRRHRYYVSRRLIARSGETRNEGWRLPATRLETAIAGLIIDHFRSPSSIPPCVKAVPPDLLQHLPARVEDLLQKLAGPGYSPLLNGLVSKGRIAPGQLSIELDPHGISQYLGIDHNHIDASALTLTGVFTLRRRGVEARLVLGDTKSAVDPTLVRNVAQGHAWFAEIRAGTSMQTIAEREGMTQRRVAHLVDLAFLAPDIVQAIVEGHQPTALTADRLIRARHRPLWSDQRTWLASL